MPADDTRPALQGETPSSVQAGCPSAPQATQVPAPQTVAWPRQPSTPSQHAWPSLPHGTGTGSGVGSGLGSGVGTGSGVPLTPLLVGMVQKPDLICTRPSSQGSPPARNNDTFHTLFHQGTGALVWKCPLSSRCVRQPMFLNVASWDTHPARHRYKIHYNKNYLGIGTAGFTPAMTTKHITRCTDVPVSWKFLFFFGLSCIYYLPETQLAAGSASAATQKCGVMWSTIVHALRSARGTEAATAQIESRVESRRKARMWSTCPSGDYAEQARHHAIRNESQDLEWGV